MGSPGCCRGDWEGGVDALILFVVFPFAVLSLFWAVGMLLRDLWRKRKEKP